jgi:DNA-directed RNA polymerase specialized sigma24 family protein
MAIAKHKSRRSELRESRVLARRVQQGDRRAFQVLYASYEGALFRFGHRLTDSSEAAASLVDATFARALATLPEDGLDSLDVGAHLFATARGLSYERHGNGNGAAHGNGNGNGNGNGHANGHADGAARSRAGGEHAREVVAANARLAPRQRMTLALRDLEGRPDDEIALALGAQSPSVPALVARARLRLREELALPSTTAGCAAHLADLSAYADATLPAEHRAALEAHLEGCADCRAALFALREAAQRYRALPVPQPPGELSTRMAAALDSAGLLERRSAPAEAPAFAPSPVPSPVPSPPPAPGAIAATVAAPDAVAVAEAAVPPATVEAPAAAPARGGRQTAAAVVMAAIVLIGIVVTLLARDGGDQRPARSSPTAPAVKAPATAAGTSHTPAGTPATRAPAVIASAGGRGPGLVSPPKLRHVRSGTRVYPHRSLPVRRPVVHAVSSRASTRRTARVRPALPAKPAAPAASEPKPIPAPPSKHKIAVQVVQPVSRPSSATPADATPPGQATTTST